MPHPRDELSANSQPSHHLSTSTAFNSVRMRATRASVAAIARALPGAAEWYAATTFLRPTGTRRPSNLDRGDSRSTWTLSGTRAELRIRLGGAVVAAEVFGERGPSVLLVHGWSGSGDDMRTIAHALVSAGWRVVALDLPAHGASPGSSTTLPDMIRAIGAVAGALGPLAGIVAHSLGGAAVTLALQERLVSTDAVVLLSPAVGPTAFVERFRRHIGLPDACVAGFVRRVEERAGRALSDLDARRAAQGLRVPALVIHDPADREVPIEQGRAIADAWPGSRMCAVPGVGHRRVLTDDVVLAAIVGFLSDTEPACRQAQKCAQLR